jgi:uncharacterized protein YyaL (SSP411 family)
MHPSSTSPAHHNHLAQETSPYLLQHAHNPVEWYPWGEAALERARAEDKPILLSIGYSACHWCHVMAHESFEDERTAAVMNELFINIKVDREERPDIDKIYQLAHQMLTQRAGGWPLTVFLSPHDLRPFFSGTYFPNAPRFGMPAFNDLLERVSTFFRSRREDIARQSSALDEAFQHMAPPPAARDEPLTLAPVALARERLAESFDATHGGFGPAPKFPHPTNIEWLLRRWRATAASDGPDLHSLYMATLTLNRMAEGGIADHLGGGFARYSVDQFWMIPHYEKMLYDNGQLLRVYANAAIATGEPLFRDAAIHTAQWMMRDMQSGEGGFWSSLDADSEGHEGKFYVWDPAEIRSLLEPSEYEIFVRRFGLDQPANFEGKWHLHVHRSCEDIAAELSLEASGVEAQLNAAREKLRVAREKRVHPGRDEKVLTSWNALAIAGMLVAGRCLQRDELSRSAFRAIDFLQEHLMQDGRLLATYKDGRARFAAYLDDYAFLLDALLEALQTNWRTRDLTFAISIADTLLERFEDSNGGGFYFTANDHEQLITRPKSFADEALPAGNAIAAQALTRLGLLLGETRYLDAAARTLRAGWQPLCQYPHAHTSLLVALEEHLDAPEIVIVRGAADEVAGWKAELDKIYAPTRLVFAIPNDVEDLPAAIGDKRPQDATVGYVCRGTTCSAPVRSLAALASLTSGLLPQDR